MFLRLVILFCLCHIFFVSDVQALQGNTEKLQRYAQDGEKALAEGRYDEAAQAYEKLRELAPNMAEAHARLGLIYFQQGRFEQAVPSLRQAIRLKDRKSVV